MGRESPFSISLLPRLDVLRNLQASPSGQASEYPEINQLASPHEFSPNFYSVVGTSEAPRVVPILFNFLLTMSAREVNLPRA